MPEADTTKFDRSVRGRPFSMDEFLDSPPIETPQLTNTEVPLWVETGGVTSDKHYYGIGRSLESSDAADNEARLRFAQFVEVRVQSIASVKIAENKERLDEDYNYESLVSTNLNLRSVQITARYVAKDSTFYSLIKYEKSDYHELVTQEIQVSLESEIRKQELDHQASEALRADSLRHKLAMDSLVLGRKQAVIDSLDHILKMEESRQKQSQARIDLVKQQYGSFLRIKPHHHLIDIPSASTPESWAFASGRWHPETGHIRQLNVGLRIWLITAETNLWAQKSILDQGDFSVKLEVLPQRGDLYPVSLSMGYVEYVAKYSEGAHIDLRDFDAFEKISNLQKGELASAENRNSTFFVTGTVGLPQTNSHTSLYYDKRKASIANTWYPFPRNLGDAVSIINQIDYFLNENYHNRFDHSFQWQIALRLTAIPNRFSTMLSYEDYEYWMLNFEFQ